MDEKLLYRIIDANLNRAKEGLRVCEDIVRFVCDDSILTQELKNLRHRILEISLDLPVGYDELLHYRDTESDVGSSTRETTRVITDLREIFLANIARAKEAVRVLEEGSKPLDAKCAQEFRMLRFSIYECEKRAVKIISAICHH